jgi:hypothetical protein
MFLLQELEAVLDGNVIASGTTDETTGSAIPTPVAPPKRPGRSTAPDIEGPVTAAKVRGSLQQLLTTLQIHHFDVIKGIKSQVDQLLVVHSASPQTVEPFLTLLNSYNHRGTEPNGLAERLQALT